MLISIFKDTYDKRPYNVKIEDVLAGIKDGRWKDKIDELRETKNDKLKFFLPAVTFAGTFLKERKASNIDNYAGLITIDIDIKDNKKIDAVKKMTTEDPFVFASFFSPRRGLKVIVRVDSTKEFHKTHAYIQSADWFRDNYPEVKIDKSGSDVSRLCYISYDPDLHYNPNAQIHDIDTSIIYATPDIAKAPKEISFEGRETNTQILFDICKNWVEKRGVSYGKGQRNNYIHNMANLLNEAGLDATQICNVIMSNHSIGKEMIKEMIDTVNGVCKRKGGKRGTLIIKPRNKTKNLFE